ncbi:MAG: substrate-binding domain-containing protein [Clostridiales bacterium]|nr:substrate-binding domain-containing protein [Clostridiales bacterium]
MKQKKVLAIVIAIVMALSLGLAACSSPAPAPAPEPAAPAPAPAPAPVDDGTKHIGFYADAADSYYSIMMEAFVGMAASDPDTEWVTDYRAGQSTADEQLRAVEDYITAGYDAIIVIQNNPGTTSECITKANDADIPYFGAAHFFGDIPNSSGATGSVNYDFVLGGKLAGQDALANGVSQLVMIEGVLGQGSASAQSLGFLLAYEEAGMSFGEKADGTPWTAEGIATEKPSVGDINGSPDITVVSWNSGGWMTEPAMEAMLGAIVSLGAGGWDGAYVQNNPMMEGAINAMADQGLSTDDYWLGSMNGREISWDWAEAGVISMDVNQSAAMEGALLYQMVKEYFDTGSVSKKHVHPYLTGYTSETIGSLRGSLVPVTDIANFLASVENDSIVWRIDDPKFLPIQGY